MNEEGIDLKNLWRFETAMTRRAGFLCLLKLENEEARLLRFVSGCLLLVAGLHGSVAYAWHDTGHKVIAKIAWENMTPAARQRAVTLLLAAPPDADLDSLFLQDARPLPQRELEFFQAASTWADIVRDRDFPERQRKYHRSSWHYVNLFWEQNDPKQPPKDRPDLKPAPENLVERLHYFGGLLQNAASDSSEKAIALAWVLHLVGDLHNPLHCAARVSAAEPEGDRGGNLFKLDSESNLHSYWDGIFDAVVTRKPNESDQDYIDGIAAMAMKRYPKNKHESKMQAGKYDAWAREGLTQAQRVVYASELQRNAAPPRSYRERTYETAEAAVALAGYRLAGVLNRLLQEQDSGRTSF